MLSRIKNAFCEHPASVDETYVQHLIRAMGFSFTLLSVAIYSFIHALFPFLFVKTTSNTLTRLYERMVIKREYTRKMNPEAKTVDH